VSIQGNWRSRRINRRAFLGLGGMSAAALLVSGCDWGARPRRDSAGYGPLVADPGGVIDLPSNFQYRIISEKGSTLSDGAPVPGYPDGMAAFPGPGDTTILVRNHELEPDDDPPVVGRNLYGSSQMGGTTGIVVGSDRIKIEDYVTSSGTQRNCAGGATRWGSWLTCEETRKTDHGYVFEVMPDDPENDLSKTPIWAMGSFQHEAAGVDPATGIVNRGRSSFSETPAAVSVKGRLRV
jgi:uncharacterized protein